MSESRRTQSTIPFARPLLAGAIAVTALSAVDAQAAIFLKITGPDIRGDSRNAMHKDEIVVTSFSAGFAIADPGNSGSGTAASRPACAPLQVGKAIDSASGALVDALMKQRTLQKAVFSFTSDGGASADYYVVTLTNAVVSSFVQTSGGDPPNEAIELVPRQVEFKFMPQSEKGVSQTSTTVVDCPYIRGPLQ
jgi:type VI secretion system secreted protein Hcp